MAYRLGLISPGFARALHLVRRIRNDFAHEPYGSSLASGSHADRVRELVLPLRDSAVYVELTDELTSHRSIPDAPMTPASRDFRVAVAVVALSLAILRLTCKPLTGEGAMDLPCSNASQSA